MTRSERTGSRAAGFIEKAVESSFPGARAFDKFRGRQQAPLIDGMAEKAAKNISKFKGSHEELRDAGGKGTRNRQANSQGQCGDRLRRDRS